MSESDFIIADSRRLASVFKNRHLPQPNIIITSPPYFDVKNYDGVANQIGYKQKYSDYIKDIVSVLKQCYAVSTADATLWLVIDTVKKDGVTLPIPFDIIKSLTDKYARTQTPSKSGWILRDIVIWNRSKNLPWHGKGRLKHEFEYVLFLSKNKNYKYYLDRLRNVTGYKEWWLTYPERYNPQGRAPSNVWEFTTPIRGWGKGRQDHLCPLPFPLVERILELASDIDDVVFDPFAGCGSVLALAKQMRRNSFGLDINSTYKTEFENAVAIGAKKYWDKRQAELSKIRRQNQLFAENNIKLRKIKLGLYLAERISAICDAHSHVVIKDNSDNGNAIDVLVVPSTASLNDLTLNLQNLIRQIPRSYKIDARIDIRDKNQFINDLGDTKLFAYLPKSPYCFVQEVTSSSIISNGINKDYIFSDIALQLDVATDSAEYIHSSHP